ncbi:MAG: gamma-glutamyl-gamma-aminobutyrate hydrolase family protein [Nitrospirota bacterium]
MKKPLKPLIGITSGSRGNPPGYPELYVRAVESAGGMARFISPDMDAPEMYRIYDGFIIPGGKDVDPALYNETQ